jgi:translocation and assembly module TamB
VTDPTRRKRRLWLRLPLIILLQVLLVAILALGWVLGTQSGLRFTLGLVEDLAPGLLQVDQVDGRVLGDLSLRGLAVRLPDLDVDLGSLDLRWQPLGVLVGTLRVQELSVRDLDLVATPAAEAEKGGPIELSSIALPVRVELEQVLVERVSLGQPGDAPPFKVDRIELVASWRGSRLEIEDLSVALPEPSMHAAVRGAADLVDDYPLDLGLAWDLTRDPGIRLEGEATLGGDLRRLTVKHELSGSAAANLEAVVLGVLEGPSWDGEIEILRIDLPAFQADLPKVDLIGRLETKGNLDDARVAGKITGEAPDLPDFGRLAVDLDIVWRDKVLDIAALELKEDDSGAHLTADGRLDLNPPDGRFELLAAWENLRWPLSGDPMVEARQGKVDAEGTFEAFNYEVTGEVWGRDFPDASLRLLGEGDSSGTRIRGLEVDTLDGKIAVEGDFSWAPQLAWHLTLRAEGLDPARQWSAIPADIGLELVSSGGLDDFGYKLDGQLESSVIPSSKLALEGRGDAQGTRIAMLRVDTLGGRLDGRAELGWEPQVNWDAELTAEGIDPGQQWNEWAGGVSGRFASKGRLAEEGPDLDALVEGLRGRLRGYPVEAEARVRMEGTEIRVEQLQIASGSTRLQAQGNAGEDLDLTFAFNSPDLKSLLPDAAGTLTVEGSASGSRRAPAVRLGVAAKGIDFAGQGIQSMSGKADLDLAAGGRIDLDLTGAGLAAGGMTFDSLRLKGEGDMGSHRLSAKVQGEPLAVELAAQGGLKEDKAYAGQVTNLLVQGPAFGDWRLQKPVPVDYSGEQVGVGPLCVRDDGGSGGCVSFAQQAAGRWTVDLDLDRLDFDLLAALIPDGLDLEGEATARGSFQAAEGVISGSARLDVPRGVLSAEAQELIQVVDFSSTRLEVGANGDGLRAGLDLPLAALGEVDAEVSLPGWRMDDPASAGQVLRGRVRATIDDLGLVSRFVPDITDVTGNLNADLGLAGTISSPVFSGYVRLANGGLAVPFIGLEVQDMSFDVEATGRDGFDYSGGLTAGEGRLGIDGRTKLGSSGADTQIKVQGERLKLADSKEYFALVSPDLQVTVSPRGTIVSGEIRVPEARIRPRTIPAGTVSPSPDVVLESEAQEQEPGRYATSVDLRLVLGNNVTVDAFGLTGRLEGDLRVLKDPGKEDILGSGEVSVIDGTYRMSTGGAWSAAIGKPLTIEQGFLNWAKSDVANPFLVLMAQREGGDVIAGLRVVGTIRNPKMTFFSGSDPGMSQSEISNYLLTGIPPRGKGDNDNRALSVGTYVAPKLFVEYDYSLGDEADKVKLRYDLNRWIELQTETGDSQGADVFFKLER